MEERHRVMLSQIAGVVGSGLGPSFQSPSAKVQAYQEAAPGVMVEKCVTELSKRMQFSNEQAQSLAADLRNTRSEVGALRGTIENIMATQMQQPSAWKVPEVNEDWMLEEPLPAQLPDAAVAKEQPSPEKGESPSKDQRVSCQRSYETSAMKAFNDHKVSSAIYSEADPRYNSCCARLTRLVEHESFEGFFGVLIVLSAAALSLEIQYESYDVATIIGYPGYGRWKEDVWPWADETFKWLERCFTVLFTMELVIRMIAMRHHLLFDKWFFLDLFVVIFSIAAVFGESPIGVNVMILRMLRVGRMIRILRIVRYIRFFDSLYLMMRSLQASFSALLWSFVLLLVIQTVTAMVLTQFIDEWLRESKDDIVNPRVFEYYGTFTRTMLTMFEIMMANWIAPARVLVSGISETWSLFFLFYRCMLGFALLAVISAVFIHETMKIANTDDELAVFLAQRETELYATKIKQAFLELDDSGDGFVNWEELGQIMEDDIMKHWLKSMQIDTSQVQNLFTLLDDGDGRISYQEFMTGIQKVKGNAKSIDVVMVLKVLNQVSRKIDQMRSGTQERISMTASMTTNA